MTRLLFILRHPFISRRHVVAVAANRRFVAEWLLEQEVAA